MKFEDAIKSVSTKLSLKRFCSAYVVDHRNLQDDELLPALTKTAPQYFFIDNVRQSLNFYHLHDDRKFRVLSTIILKEILLNADDYNTSSKDLNRDVVKFQNGIIDESNEPAKIYKGNIARDHDLFEFIVGTAWEMNDNISADEKNLIDKIRRKLKISERDYYVLEARLNKFPQEGNRAYTLDDINDVRLSLHSKGLLIEVRDDDGVDYDAIPDEVAETIREVYGIEVKRYGYTELLQYKHVRKKDYLKEILLDCGYEVDKYASLSEMQELVLESISPSNLIGGLTPRGGLSVDDLKEWCEAKGMLVGGNKNELIDRIIKFYDGLRLNVDDAEDERVIWYKYIEQLACRDYEFFRSQNLIMKDLEIEHKFEAATNYLFQAVLGHKPLSLIGNKHEDGRLSLAGGVLLWDNKSSEKSVSLKNHIRQFDGYIRSSEKPVEAFLVIAPSFTEDSAAFAMQYFVEERIMFSLITAKDLKAVAERFRNSENEKSFSLRYLIQLGLFNIDLVKF